MTANGRQRLAEAYEEARDHRSYESVWRACYGLIGEAMPTQQALRDYHRSIPEKWNVELVAVLCRVYGLDLGEIAPEMQPRLKKLVAIVGGDNPPDLGDQRSWWNVDQPEMAAVSGF